MEKPRGGAPSIIVGYPPDENGMEGEKAAYAVVYVRPETNGVLYERAIVAGIRGLGRAVFIANLGGGLFIRDRILECHYAPQFRFARDPRAEMELHPSLPAALELHFGARPIAGSLIGSFEAVERLGLNEEELFETIVPDRDFLERWGQEFKRIGGHIVANPSLPAVVKRYVPEANVFAVVVKSPGPAGPEFFTALNQSIYDRIVSGSGTPVVDGDKLGFLAWSEKIRRTYHISTNHLMAMFDMMDFVYTDGERRLEAGETPLGRMLLAAGVLTREKLEEIGRVRLLTPAGDARAEPVHLPTAGAGKGIRDVEALLRRF